MPVANKNARRPHPPTKSTGKRQPSGTTHFQFRPNQFGGGRGLGSMSETKLKSARASVTIRSGIPRLTLGMTRQAGFPDSSRQRLLGIRHGVGGDGNDRGIFLQFARNNFVQRVSGSVMIVKIKTAVLHGTEGWHTGLFHRLDVSADVLGQIQSTGADVL